MKYSFMSFSCPQLSLEETLKVAKLYGYDAIEPRIDCGHKHGIEVDIDKSRINQIVSQVEESGIEISCIATSCSYADPEKVKENIEKAKKSIELAANVGAKSIRIFGGTIPDGIDKERSMDQLVNSLKGLADFAGEKGVIICLETHDSWSDPANAVTAMERINHPAVAVNWDLMHPVLWADWPIERAFKALKPWIKHVHVHDGIDQNGKYLFKPIGTGSIDHKTAISLLNKMQYTGFISGEWINWDPYEIHLPRELKIMKQYERESNIR